MRSAKHRGRELRTDLERIDILTAEHEKAVDLLEPLLKVPYFLTGAWLTIDPNRRIA